MAETPCRCGHADAGLPHPCHGGAYTCRKPARQYFYNPRPVALAGMQMKLGISETWACDECWDSFVKLMATHQENGAKSK